MPTSRGKPNTESYGYNSREWMSGDLSSGPGSVLMKAARPWGSFSNSPLSFYFPCQPKHICSDLATHLTCLQLEPSVIINRTMDFRCFIWKIERPNVFRQYMKNIDWKTTRSKFIETRREMQAVVMQLLTSMYLFWFYVIDQWKVKHD